MRPIDASRRLMRTRIVVAAVILVAGSGGVRAQAAPASTPPKKVCVNAEVNGQVALSYDCLSQQLAPTAPASAGVNVGNAGNVAEGLATAPSNKVGTFNYSAESIRFGSNWGKSVQPQRPAPAPVVPLR